MDDGKRKRDRAVEELEKFEASLANFFQTNAPETWPHAAKTLAHETLFHDAADLGAKQANSGANSVWGVEMSTDKLPVSTGGYDRETLEANLQALQKALAHDTDQLAAAQQRYVAAVDAFERQAAEAHGLLLSKVDSSDQLCRTLRDEADQLENRVITLQSQFEAHRREWRSKLEKRDNELNDEERHAQCPLVPFGALKAGKSGPKVTEVYRKTSLPEWP